LGLAGAVTWMYLQVTDTRAEVRGDRPPPVDDKSARFLDMAGAVKVRKSGTYEWIDANAGITLTKDDTIRTVGDSHARVRLFDGTEYLVKPDSILVIEEATEDPNTKATRVAVSLTAGQVNLTTPRGGVTGSRRDVQTPTTEATFAENTSADVSFDTSTRKSGVTIFSGQSDVRSGDKKIQLSAAQAIDVSADGSFSDIIELPAVPALVSPANLSLISVAETTEFKWRPVEGARRYNVVLDRSPYFKDPILESTVPNVSILHRGLAAGTYYWQVTAIDADNRRGAPSEFAKFTVTTRVTASDNPPELSVFRPSVTLDGLVTVRGRTIVGAVVTVDRGMGDDKVQVKEDGSFTYYFQVRETGRHPVIVKARRRDGGGVAEKTVYAEIGTD
ncbi:MAG TPA: FecR domain-containing protein, partial [Vicinamibacteria bacterium]|nr:FecR domain-containing protein [Vicinamibacteria bacterium]